MPEKSSPPDPSGLPAEQSDQNNEEPGYESRQPTRKPPGRPGGGDPDAGGESSEGSQSTGNPDSAG